jgi:hypothetical protein
VCAQILLIWDCAYDRITQNVIGQLTKKIGPHEIGGLGLGSGTIRHYMERGQRLQLKKGISVGSNRR